MNYLLSPIRRELEERVDYNATKFVDGLIVDFENSDLIATKVAHKLRCSLLDSPCSAFDVLAQYAAHSFDCIVVNLQISWLDFAQLSAELRRLLRPQGVLYFSAFGPDTLAEVRNGWAEVDTLPHVHPFVDMHHLGDTLLHSGFVEPIVDVDWIYVDYPDIGLLFDDLKQACFTNIHSQRRKTLTGKQRFNDFKKAIQDSMRNDENAGQKINISFEVIYGFAKNRPQSTSIHVMPPSR